MLHRFHRAVMWRDRAWLKGVVEVNETYLAVRDTDAPVPEDQRMRRKNCTHQALVVMAVELLQPKGFGGIRLCRTDNDSAEQLVPSVQQASSPTLRHAPMARLTAGN